MLIRRARPEDAAAIAAVHLQSSDDAYAPLARDWPRADPIARAARWTKTFTAEPDTQIFVAEAAEADAPIIGFAAGGPSRRKEPGVASEVYVIHVLPGQRGRRVGEALWNEITNALRNSSGSAGLYVDTLAELACCRFYERHGGIRIEERPIDFRGAQRTHVTYRWGPASDQE